MSIFKNTIPRHTIIGIALCLMAGTASAELLGVEPGRPEITVFPADHGPDEKPNIKYVAANDNLVVNGTANKVVIEYGVGNAELSFITVGRLSIDLGIDETGALTGGQVEVTGQFTSGGMTYASPLLTGRIVEIGFFDDPDPEVINGDRFDFRFELTGGSMAPLYADDDIGVVINLESSNFGGSFAGDWTAFNVKGNVGPIPPLECTGTIGDFVWRDNDRDGIQDSGEPGIGNVLVELFDSTGTRIATDRTDANGTDANGEYGFTGLCAGDYTVRISSTDPDTATALDGLVPTLISSPGSNPTNDSDNHGGTPVTLTTDDSDDDTIDFGYKPPVLASLGDFVWEDLNGNGIQNSGEPGVEGVTVNLLSNPDGDAACNSESADELVIRTTSTDGTGFYEFIDLTPGDYCVQFVLPTGYAYTDQDQGSDDTLDSDADPATGKTANTNLSPGDNDPTLDAGVVQPASLGNFVWFDFNQDGIQDPNEVGIDGVRVELYDCSGSGDIISSTETVTNEGEPGYYIFDNLAPGGYTVKFIKPSDNYTFSPTGEGTDETDSDANTSTGESACITLESGENNDTIDAGLYPTLSRLGDFVWNDLNADGIQNDGNTGIEGVTVELLACNGRVIDSTTTNGDGFYYFENLAPGSYQVRFTTPSGFIQSPINQGADDKDSDADSDGLTDCVTLNGMDEDLTLDAGFYQPASLGNFVWEDTDGDGIQDLGEPGVGGVIVTLFDCENNELDSTTTDSNGLYLFDGLVPGDYTVMFTATGRTFTTEDSTEPGADDANDSDADGNGKTGCYTLKSGDENLTVDAGLVPIPVAECDLSVTATCAIIPPLSSGFVCSDAKPIDTLTMKWHGQDNVTVVAYDGKVDDAELGRITGVINGQDVSFSGFAGAGNDIEWQVLDADGNSLGISRFHLSCSDSGMNGPEDCGMPQGNSKDDDSGFLNDWLLEGLIGENGDALQCTPPAPGPGAESCEFTTSAGPHCQGKVESISLRYLGGDCIISNTQDDKAECLVSGSAGEQPVRIKVSDGGSKVYFDSGEANIEVGNVIEAAAMAAGDDDFGSNTVIEIFSSTHNLVQEVEFHTSCSKPLNLGDQFGAVEVVGLDTTEGGSAAVGADVLFSYLIVNNSNERFVDDASDSFGSLGELDLAADGGSASLSRTAFVMPDAGNVFTNTLSVSGNLDPSGLLCGASDSVPVTREEPPAPQLECSEIKPITDLSMVWNGANGVNVSTAGGQYFADIQNGDQITFDVAGLGNEVGMTLSGSVEGFSSFHVSCSDDGMDGPEDCDTAQGNSKDDDPDLENQWLLGAMIGESGSFTCPVLDGAPVVEPSDDPGTGTGGDSILPLDSWVDGNKLKMEMENLSNGDLFIESVVFTWPEGELKKMKFNGDFVKDIDKTSFGTAGSITVPDDLAFEDDPNKRKIKSGETRKLEIEFDDDIEDLGLTPADFTVTIVFSDGSEVNLSEF